MGIDITCIKLKVQYLASILLLFATTPLFKHDHTKML